mmetsp:Transcript_23478/g.58753  ORF Transcript_23478/g.58753 Transcript_23478/m.58753 type:complete len:394 (-) Transcript_23478:191-1372(-)
MSSAPVAQFENPGLLFNFLDKESTNLPSNARLGVQMWLDKNRYLAGELINGVVLLNNVKSTVVEDMSIVVRGVEEASWEEVVDAHPEPDQPVRRRTISEKRQVFYDELKLAGQGTISATAEYCYPFNYQIPPHLPGSFDYVAQESGGVVSCQIQYTLETVIRGWDVHGYHESSRDRSVSRSTDSAECSGASPAVEVVRYSRGVTVGENFSGSVRKAKVENRRILACGGDIELSVDINKDVFFPGEYMYITSTVLNTSTEDVAELKVRLWKRIALTAEGGAHTHTTQRCEEVANMKGIEVNTRETRVEKFGIPHTCEPSSTGVVCRLHYEVEVVAMFQQGDPIRLIALPIALCVPQYLDLSPDVVPPDDDFLRSDGPGDGEQAGSLCPRWCRLQ